MKNYFEFLHDWSIKKKTEGLESEVLPTLQKALKQMHTDYFTPDGRTTTSKQDLGGAYTTKDLLKALSSEKHRPASLINEAKAGSQGTFYNLLRGDNMQIIADPAKKIVAILVFLAERYGIHLTFDQHGELAIGSQGRFAINIEQPTFRPVLETDVTTKNEAYYVAYYWRDDKKIGISTIRLYHYTERGKYFQQADMAFYYDNRTVTLTGKVQPSDNKHQDTTLNLFIHLEDDERQKIENIRNPSIPVVTNLAISIPDTHKRWEDHKVLFAAYNSVHRKKDRYAYAGVMYLLQIQPTQLDYYADRKAIPDYIHYILFQNRLHAPYKVVTDIEKIPGYYNAQNLLKNFVGLYYVYYVNARHNTLEKAVCEIKPTGQATLTSYDRLSKLEGQCFLAADLYCYIYFNFKEEGEHSYARFTYTLERSTSEECIYAIYSGLNSHTDLISGRAYFEKIAPQEAQDPDLQSFPIIANDRKLNLLFGKKRKLYTYLIGDSYQLYSDNKTLSRYVEDSLLSRNKTIEQPDISGSYILYALNTNLDPSEQNPDKNLCIAQYPVRIDRFGIFRIKGRLGEYSDKGRLGEYSDDRLTFHEGTFSGRFNIRDNSRMEVLFYYEKEYKQSFIKGIITRKLDLAGPVLDSRVCLLIPYPDQEGNIFDNVDYQEDIKLDGDEAKSIDSRTGGAISYLRGSLNRSLVVKVRDSLHPRREGYRKLHFYAACYLAKRKPEQCYPELERAFAHGFASRKFMDKFIFDEEFKDRDDIKSLRDDWTLLLTEISEAGSLSSAKRLDEVKKLWNIDDLSFIPDDFEAKVELLKSLS